MLIICLEAVGLEVADADGDDLEVGRAKRRSDVRGLGKLVVDRALRNELYTSYRKHTIESFIFYKSSFCNRTSDGN